MSDEIDWTSLDHYFSCESTPSEAAAIERWVAGDPTRAEELEVARRIWEEARVVHQRFDVRAAKAKMHAKMAESVQVSIPIRAPRFAVPAGNKHAWAIAAGLAALVAGTVIWHAAQPTPSSISGVVATREYVTRRGQRSEFRLPDGTRVMLGPESRLIVASAYGVTAREVRLEGQGYFDVVHNERRPFVVRAGGAVARDLGTKFGVQAYAADRSVRVAVAEGRVALETQVLSPGQIGERAVDGRLTVRTGVDLDRYLAWTSGRLVFEDTPLAEALPELHRWYNLNFQLADSSLARLPLTGTLTDQPSAETLDLLAISLGVSVERRGDTVVLGREHR